MIKSRSQIIRKAACAIAFALGLFTMPQSGAYASHDETEGTAVERLVKKIAEKNPLFYGFAYHLNDVCAVEKQAILEFRDSDETTVVENYARQATICLEKLKEVFFGDAFVDWDLGDNARIIKHYRSFYCQERYANFIMAVDSDIQSLRMIYDEHCGRSLNLIDSADSCSIRLRRHFDSIVEVKTILGGLEVTEIPESAKRIYSGDSPEQLQLKHNGQEYEVYSQCAQVSGASKFGFDNLALLFEFRKKNRDAYLGYVQEYLNAKCDAGKTCRKDPEMAANLWRDNLHFYGPIGQKDLEIFAMSRGDERILPAARAAIAKMEATRKADIDRICAEYTFENPGEFCDKFGKE